MPASFRRWPSPARRTSPHLQQCKARCREKQAATDTHCPSEALASLLKNRNLQLGDKAFRERKFCPDTDRRSSIHSLHLFKGDELLRNNGRQRNNCAHCGSHDVACSKSPVSVTLPEWALGRVIDNLQQRSQGTCVQVMGHLSLERFIEPR
eukprot:4693281-Amphidinium_carterae.1